MSEGAKHYEEVVQMAVLEATRAGLASELARARDQSQRLFSILHPSVLYERPIAERHRVVFYIGHLDAFDYIQICREGLGLKSREPQLDALFQAGIDPDSTSLPSDTRADWPALPEVMKYIEQARGQVDDALDTAPEQAVFMALEHRLMHVETLAYMFHNFPSSAKSAPSELRQETSRPYIAGRNELCEIPSGEATLGKQRDDQFGWDNEYEQTRRFVPGFRIQQHKVTNGEYLRFVDAGAAMPHFWSKQGDRLYQRGMFSDTPLPLDWPVYVTQREATAYATWLGMTLPTEAQFDRAGYGDARPELRRFPWGDAEPEAHHGNFDFRRWEPESVYATAAGASQFGVGQLAGNGWEWTSSVFEPFEGFLPSPSYSGYSANFFDGQHYVMKGASPLTAARLLRRSFRNWFRPEYPYVYAGFRCVEN
jgi:gamma-glutamyl hercynylcysteine S-oxide synthase